MCNRKPEKRALFDLTNERAVPLLAVRWYQSIFRKDNLGVNAPPYSTIVRWCIEFKRGRTSIKDGPYSGRPTKVVTEEIALSNTQKDSIHRKRFTENNRDDRRRIRTECLGVHRDPEWINNSPESRINKYVPRRPRRRASSE
ncbi:hypothetical protein EVAR_53026_1 [Eumeta japonica]|uniref:Uncharacterized protein n=1 Tax=Eumeta variegata TaxID=151549 RepID=A0A4C1XQL0_EUMVA|nr:hypothetical protein EVAR_53026_1 [Eumeta japonica]